MTNDESGKMKIRFKAMDQSDHVTKLYIYFFM